MAEKKVSKKKEKINISPQNNGLISYIVGIVAIVQSLISPLSGVVLGIIGLSFSTKEKTRLSKKAKNLNIVAIVIGVLTFILIMALSTANLGVIPTQ